MFCKLIKILVSDLITFYPYPQIFFKNHDCRCKWSIFDGREKEKKNENERREECKNEVYNNFRFKEREKCRKKSEFNIVEEKLELLNEEHISINYALFSSYMDLRFNFNTYLFLVELADCFQCKKY